MDKACKVDIVFPVYYNNIDLLEESVLKTLDYTGKIRGPYNFAIVISINGPRAEPIIEKAVSICRGHDSVRYIYTPQQGKGCGVLNAWRESSADIMVYMDIDLATSLDCLEPLLGEIAGGADIAVGSRYLPNSRLKRTLLRLALSRIYHVVFINFLLLLPISDVQCGFKAVRKSAFLRLAPFIRDRIWFFEAEMLYIAHRMGMRISEVPVVWVECTVSGVKLVKTSILFLIKVIELKVRYLFRRDL